MADFFIGNVAFAAAVGFLTGILAVSFGWPLFYISGAFVAAGALAMIIFRDGRFFYGGIISFAAVLFGAYYFYFFTALRSAAAQLPTTTGNSFRVIVSTEPVASEKYLSFSAALQPPFSGNITVFASPGSDIQYGDLLEIVGTVQSSRNVGELPAVFPKRIGTISRGNGFWLQEELLNFKAAINEKFGEFLPQDKAALLGGMTLGGTTGMSAAVKNDMTASETMYVASMYGYKIAVIVAVIDALFVSFLSRRIRFGIAAFVTVLFVMMSGANSSAMRGGVMMGILLLAKETGEIFSKRNALVLTAAGMAVFDPTIVAQAGFLFSFSSVAGMAFLAEPIRRFLHLGDGRGMLGWKEAVIVSISSLVPIVPLISNMFGSFSLTAIFANVLVAPVISLGMATGATLAAAGFAWQYLAFFVAHAASVLLSYVLWVAHFFAMHAIPLSFKFSGFLSFLLYYGFLALFIYTHGGTENKTA